MEQNLELHSLMTDMQIGYYMALKYNSETGKVTNQKEAVAVLKQIAKDAIVNKRIPRALFMYAKVFLLSNDPMAVVERAYQVYSQENPEEVAGDGTLAMQA